MNLPLPVVCATVVGLGLAVGDPRVEFAFGVLEEFRGDPGRAAERFEQARHHDPVAAPLVRRAVARQLAAGERPAAIRLYSDLSQARPDDLGLQLEYADFLVREGRGDALALKLATEALDAQLERNPGDPEVIRRLCSIQLSKGDLPRAQQLAARLAPDDPAAVMVFADLTRTLHDKDDAAARQELARRFDLALNAHPEDAPLARAASEFHRQSGNRAQAIDSLVRHTAAAPWSLELRTRLAMLFFSAGRDAEGERALLDVLAIHPRHGQAHRALAKFHRLNGRGGPAAHHAGEALKILGGDPAGFLQLANEHLAADRPREARILLEKAVFDHPDDAGLRMRLAIASRRDPETRDRAARLFREAESAVPEGRVTDPVFLTESAEALIAAGQSKAAEERLRAAIRLHPPDARKETAATLRRLASLWETENRNLDAARALRQRADSLDPATRE